MALVLFECSVTAMPTNPRHVVSISMYANKDGRTLVHLVRDTLETMTNRNWSLTETLRFCVEEHGRHLLADLVDILKEPSNRSDNT